MGTGVESYERAGAKPPADCQDLAPAWTERLGEAIAREVLPLLANRHAASESPERPRFSRAEIAAFTDLITADDMDQLRAVADRIVEHAGRNTLLHELLAPAALLLGERWERDTCDFMTVTLGIYRLSQIVKETAFAGQAEIPVSGFEHRILLLPAPGEQHGFGLGLVADAFRQGGWCVRSGPAVGRAQLLRLVRGEWFDVIGFSISAERALTGLPACIRAARSASRNRGAFVLVGGPAILTHCERTRFLGADGTAASAHDALALANASVQNVASGAKLNSRARMVDAR